MVVSRGRSLLVLSRYAAVAYAATTFSATPTFVCTMFHILVTPPFTALSASLTRLSAKYTDWDT